MKEPLMLLEAIDSWAVDLPAQAVCSVPLRSVPSLFRFAILAQRLFPLNSPRLALKFWANFHSRKPFVRVPLRSVPSYNSSVPLRQIPSYNGFRSVVLQKRRGQRGRRQDSVRDGGRAVPQHGAADVTGGQVRRRVEDSAATLCQVRYANFGLEILRR